MPFNPNPTTGGTVYTPGQFFSGKVLTSDWMTANAAWGKVGSTTAASNEGATLRTLPDLDIAVGKYERLIARYQIFYTGTANSDFKFLLTFRDRTASPGVITPTLLRIANRYTATDDTAEVTSVLTAEGSGTAVTGGGGTDGYVDLNVVLNNGATAGDLHFQYAQNTDHADDVIVRAGSFVEFQRF